MQEGFNAKKKQVDYYIERRYVYSWKRILHNSDYKTRQDETKYY